MSTNEHLLRNPKELEAAVNSIERERVRAVNENRQISESRSFLLGRALIAAATLDLRGMVRFARRLIRRNGGTYERPKRFMLLETGQDKVAEFLLSNPEMRLRHRSGVLVIGDVLEEAKLKQIGVARANAESLVLAHPGRDLVVNLDGVRRDDEWGGLFQVDDMATNRFFSKLVLICRANRMGCHVIVGDSRMYPLIAKFDGSVRLHGSVFEYLQTRLLA